MSIRAPVRDEAGTHGSMPLVATFRIAIVGEGVATAKGMPNWVRRQTIDVGVRTSVAAFARAFVVKVEAVPVATPLSFAHLQRPAMPGSGFGGQQAIVDADVS